MELNKTQKAIIESIEHELSLKDKFYTPQPMFASVWFYPEKGFFLYADAPVQYDVVYPLIKEEILKYKGLVKHQGEYMPKYDLNK